MSTATTTYTHVPTAKSGTKGWFGRFLDRMIEAQMAVARQRVCEHLRSLNDEALQRIGFSAEEIARLRAGEVVAFPTERS